MMACWRGSKISIVFVTILLFYILPHNVNSNTSPIMIDGKYSLDSDFHPIESKEECNNYYTNNQYVCDPNNYITYPDKQKLGDIMEKSGNYPIISCPFKTDGIQFGIFIISSFNDYHSNQINDQQSDIAESSRFYAKLFHEKWEIGNEECNNGILIFLNVKDRYLYISTSKYLKANYISDAYINTHIMPEIGSYLKNKNYVDGLIKIIELITDKCQQQLLDKMMENEHQNEIKTQLLNTISSNNDGLWIFLIVIAGIIFIVWCIWKTGCYCCGECNDDDNNNNYVYGDEGVPFQPGMNNNVNRMNANIPRNDNNYLRSRSVHNSHNVNAYNTYNEYNKYPKQQFRMKNNLYSKNKQTNNAEKLRKEMEKKQREQIQRKEKERKQREEKERLKMEKVKNEELMLRMKRTKNGGGGGMSFDDNNNREKLRKDRERKQREDKERLKLEKEKNKQLMNKGKRTKYGGGAGMSWDNAPDQTSDVKKRFNRTNDDDGGGGSW